MAFFFTVLLSAEYKDICYNVTEMFLTVMTSFLNILIGNATCFLFFQSKIYSEYVIGSFLFFGCFYTFYNLEELIISYTWHWDAGKLYL